MTELEMEDFRDRLLAAERGEDVQRIVAELERRGERDARVRGLLEMASEIGGHLRRRGPGG